MTPEELAREATTSYTKSGGWLLPKSEYERLESLIALAISKAVAAEREACDVDCAERLGAERLAMRAECDYLRARNAKLERVVEAARGVPTVPYAEKVALLDARINLRNALADLDATTRHGDR